MYIGIDLGTSSCKGLLVDKQGKILRIHAVPYDVSYPKDGYSEQDPKQWIDAVDEILDKLSEGIKDQILGISFGGQMHGLVALDENDKVIRPCILWNDARTEEETRYLNEKIGKDVLSAETANIAFAGFTAPKLLWMKKNEPENFARIAKIMLPKDYAIYRLTGVHATDYSDASGMLLLDVKNKKWSKRMCEVCSVKESWLPKLFESYEVVGKPKPEYGLPNAVVTAGAGDNAAAAIGTGCIHNGECNVSLGTSGTVFIASDKFSVDKNNALHSFDHANGKYHLMGCILAAASCNKWWLEKVLQTTDYKEAYAGLKLGENPVFFLPYMMGERSPHNDPFARSAFIGMRPDTSAKDMSLAILEGVSFALKDCLEIARDNGIEIKKATVCGGGAKNHLWMELLANILDVDVYCLENEQGPAYGAAILAMVGRGDYKDFDEASKAIIRKNLVASPDDKLREAYKRKYEIFRSLYPALKDSFALMNKNK